MTKHDPETKLSTSVIDDGGAHVSTGPAAASGSTIPVPAAAAAAATAPPVTPFHKRPQRSSYLSSLSEVQLKAATHPITNSLQILAGPGSGKTRVLTSRVAWLILDPSNNINPANIVVVTFTNKAANEMKARLTTLIGPARVANLIIGTFHATCAKYLRKYAQLINLSNNFTIVDADDSKKIYKSILDFMKKDLQKDHITIKPEDAMSEVSKAKAKDISVAKYREEALKSSASPSQQAMAAVGFRSRFGGDFKRIMAEIYERYQQTLDECNALDFDDLLVHGVRLFRDHPEVAKNIEHVLVDEFQDTNTAQYMLMSLMARHCRSISVVGDPDQSIYGWRSAEVGNLKKMCSEFKGTEQVRLEENFRSTAAILEASLKVVQQDRARVEKGLHTSHPRGPPVTLRWNSSAQKEAWFIASEIKRAIAYSGGLLDFNDFAVLLRFNALSRSIEAEFQAQGISSRMVGGHKFFDRMEVKDILGYLALADNPGFMPAFVRVVNVPKRGIGDSKISDLRMHAREGKTTMIDVAERVVKGKLKIAGMGDKVKRSLAELVVAVNELRDMAQQRKPVSQLIEALLKRINYESYLKREKDYESRWENVKELISFATMLENTNEQTAAAMLKHRLNGEDAEEGDFVDPDLDDGASMLTTTPSTKAPSQRTPSKTKSPLKREQDDIIDLISSDDEDDKGRVELETDDKSRVKTEAGASQGAKTKAATASSPPDKKRVKKAKKHFGDAMLDRSSGSPDKASAKKEDPDHNKELYRQAVLIGESDDDMEEEAAGIRAGDESDGDEEEDEEKTPLRVFLEASILATDTTEAEDEDGKAKPKVTISTCHAAKGLEWPVVFVPAVEEGTYPAFRCEQPHEIDEECRLLYVAMTRAETMLYLCWSSERMAGGETRSKVLSHFIASIAKKKDGGGATDEKGVAFCTSRPAIDTGAVDDIVKVTGRPKPNPAVIESSVKKFGKTQLGRELSVLDEMERGERGSGGRYGGRSYSGGGGFAPSYGSNYGAGSSLGRFSGSGSFAPSSSLGAFSNGNLVRNGSSSSSSSSSFGTGDSAALRQNLGFSRPTIGSFSTALLDDHDGEGSKRPGGAGGGSYMTVTGLYHGSGRSSSGGTLGMGGRSKKPLIPPSLQVRQGSERAGSTASVPPPAPRFTDEVRLRARPEDAIEAASGRSDGMAPRRRADLESFQQAHSSGISSILGMLPPDDGGTAATIPGTGGSGGGAAAGNGRKRLGMGMARRLPPAKR